MSGVNSLLLRSVENNSVKEIPIRDHHAALMRRNHFLNFTEHPPELLFTIGYVVLLVEFRRDSLQDPC
jgi:hypothetical protein